MDRDRLDRLTDAQRVCLRLVYTHHNSKEIAAMVGVSPSAIDKRVERAVQMLGVATRFEAARLLHRSEHAGGTAPDASPQTSERLPSDAIDVPSGSDAWTDGDQDDPLGLVRRFLGLGPASGFEGKARIRGTRTERLARLLLLMVAIAVSSVALVSLTMAVTSMLRAHRGEPARSTAANAVRGVEPSMLKQRRQAAEIVTAEFLRAEQAADAAAEATASCVTTLLRQRVAANLPVATGLQALQLVADASADLIRARQRLVEAHGALIEVRSQIGLASFYGDESECPPNEGALRASGGLQLVVA